MKKIDPYLLFEQLVEQHVKTVLDWVKLVKLQRSLSDYQNALRYASISVADVNPYTFVENRIISFLKSYDKIEKDLGTTYSKVLTWLREHKISEASIQAANEVALLQNRDDIEKMVKEINSLAKLLIDDCNKLGYTGDNITFLEVLSKQTATEVIAMFIKFY